MVAYFRQQSNPSQDAFGSLLGLLKFFSSKFDPREKFIDLRLPGKDCIQSKAALDPNGDLVLLDPTLAESVNVTQKST